MDQKVTVTGKRKATEKDYEDLKRLLEQLWVSKAVVDSSSSVDKLNDVIVVVLEKVGNKFKHFKLSSKKVGSVSSGPLVAAVEAIEIDRLCMLSINGEVEYIPTATGFAKFKVDQQDRKVWEDCTNKEGFLIPRTLSTKLKESTVIAISELDPLAGIETTKIEVEGGHSVAIEVRMPYVVNEIEGKVKCDLVLLIECRGFPPEQASWLNTENSSQIWPTVETVKQIKDIGFGLVAKNVYSDDVDIDKEQPDLDLMWRYSTARAEQHLLNNCPKLLPILLIILKAIRLYEFPEESFLQPPVTSYHIKNILFHEAYDFPDIKDWTLAKRFVSALKRLLKSIEDDNLPHFFFPCVNLLPHRKWKSTDEKDEIKLRLKKMVGNPIWYLKKLLISWETTKEIRTQRKILPYTVTKAP